MRIVIIDDEEVICDGIRRTIESSGEEWAIEAVYGDPEEALEFSDWDPCRSALGGYQYAEHGRSYAGGCAP